MYIHVHVHVHVASLQLYTCTYMHMCSCTPHCSFSIYRVLKLTVEQKCDIATSELDELREEVQRKKAEMERSHDTHKVTVC